MIYTIWIYTIQKCSHHMMIIYTIHYIDTHYTYADYIHYVVMIPKNDDD